MKINHLLTALFVIASAMIIVAPLQLGSLFIVMSLLVPFAYRDQYAQWPHPPRAMLLLGAAILIYVAVTVTWSPIPYHSLYSFAGFSLLVLSIISTGTVCGLCPLPAVIKLRGMVTAGYLGILILLTLDIFCNHPIYRVWHHLTWSTPVRSAVTTRSVTVMVMLLWPMLYWLSHRPRKLSMGGLWLVAGTLALFSNTASGRAGFVCGTLVFCLAQLRPQGGVQWARALVAALIVGGFMVAVPAVQLLKAKGMGDNPTLNVSFRQRIEIWDFSTRRFLEKPWQGWGFDSARAVPRRDMVSQFEAPDHGIMLHPHNMFLQSLLELGVMGSALIIVMMLQLWYRIHYLAAALQPFAYASYAAIITMASFSYGIWQVWWLSAFALTAYAILIMQPRADEII